MEQAQCWMLTKQKHSLNPKNQESMTTKPSYEDVSWEEQAFAEDAAGHLGGCIWPPRSYSCSFCRREFRSAQALGGHMNIHRRDRAILKQSTSLDHHHPHQNNHNHVQYPPSQFSALVYNPNPNSDFNSRVSAPPTQENYSSENTLVVSPPSMVQGPHMINSSPRSWSNFDSGRYCGASDSKTEDKNQSLLLSRKRPTLSDEEEEEYISSKRKRGTDASPLPFFLKSRSSELSSLEDLDLELRLGDPPQVK